MEPAVTLHGGVAYDLDFTLERGMVEVANGKKEGSACVQIRARDQAWEAVLKDPDSRLLMEYYSGWPKGARFKKQPGPEDVPIARMTFLVLKGQMILKHDGIEMAMVRAAGAGRHRVGQRHRHGPQPASAWTNCRPGSSSKTDADKAFAKGVEERVARFAEEAKSKSFDAAIDKFLASDDPLDRRLGVIVLAASDQLPRLGKVLRESTSPTCGRTPCWPCATGSAAAPARTRCCTRA